MPERSYAPTMEPSKYNDVVKIVDLLQDENHTWCGVMKFCAGGDLYATIRKAGMGFAEVEYYFKRPLIGLGHPHGQGIAHRDIKPENLFLDFPGQLKVRAPGRYSVPLYRCHLMVDPSRSILIDWRFAASTVYRLPLD